MNLERTWKTIHETSKLDPRVVESADELVELLLGGDDEPHAPASHSAEVLDDRLKIEHLLHVTRHELADLVDHEHKRAARLASVHELLAAFGEETGIDV